VPLAIAQDIVDIAQIATAVAAVLGVGYAVRLGERTLRRHDEQLARQDTQLEEYTATEGGLYCNDFRRHVLELSGLGLSPPQIRELLAHEHGMVRASPEGTECLPPEEAVRAVREEPGIRLTAEQNCGRIEEILRLPANR